MLEPEVSFSLPSAGRLRELLARHEKPGPRYTSYPTAPVWSEAFGEAEHRAALRACTSDDLSVYVHIPFCERLCSFCACNRKITQDHAVAAPYLDGIEREAGMLASELAGSPQAVQVALGGGSPNFLSARELERLFEILDAHFPPAPGAERSIELDPRNTTRDQLEALVAHGVNRVSLGVQDTSPVVQRAINRIQPREKTEALAADARALGVASVNFDLIYGLPFQTLDSYADTLDHVLAMRPDRIALYSYAHVTWISKAQRGFERKDLPEPERKLAIFMMAIERLLAAGYQFLGLDHFALPDDELAVAAREGGLRRNFMGYTTRAGVDLVGLGASAISDLAGCYAQSEREPGAYLDRVDGGRLATLRGWRLGDDDLRRRWLIQRLMCQGEVAPAAYEARFGESLKTRLPDLERRLAPLVEDALLEHERGGYRVTPVGRLFLRVIAMCFDAYLAEPGAGKPRYSRTV